MRGVWSGAGVPGAAWFWLVGAFALCTGACAVGVNTPPDGARGDATRTDGVAPNDVRIDVRTDVPTSDVRDASAPPDVRDVATPPPIDVVVDPPEDVVTPQPDVEIPPPVDVLVPPPVDVFVPPPVDVFVPPPDVVTPTGMGSPGMPCVNDGQCGTGGADCCFKPGSLPIGVCACRDPLFRACQPLTCP